MMQSYATPSAPQALFGLQTKMMPRKCEGLSELVGNVVCGVGGGLLAQREEVSPRLAIEALTERVPVCGSLENRKRLWPSFTVDRAVAKVLKSGEGEWRGSMVASVGEIPLLLQMRSEGIASSVDPCPKVGGHNPTHAGLRYGLFAVWC